EQAVNGYTREEREIAVANVGKALADIKAVQSIIDQMVVYAPVASQVYQRNVNPGEYVSPGVPLVTLIDLNDMWVRFDLREDLVKTLKLGDRFGVRIPALSDRRITVAGRSIRRIAQGLERSPSTVSREIRRRCGLRSAKRFREALPGNGGIAPAPEGFDSAHTSSSAKIRRCCVDSLNSLPKADISRLKIPQRSRIVVVARNDGD